MLDVSKEFDPVKNGQPVPAAPEIDMDAIIRGEVPIPAPDPLEVAECARRKAEWEARMAPRTVVRPGWETVCESPAYRNSDPAELPDQAASAKVLAWKYGQRGLLLHGESRLGKSRTAWLLLRRIFDDGKTIAAFDGFSWFTEVSTALMDMPTANRWMKRLTAFDVVFLDDIFRGRMTEAQDLALWALVERRVSSGMPVIVTTNVTGETLPAQFKPIIARLREFCIDVPFAGSVRKGNV